MFPESYKYMYIPDISDKKCLYNFYMKTLTSDSEAQHSYGFHTGCWGC